MVIPTKKDIGKRITFKLNWCAWIPKKETRIIKNVITAKHKTYAIVRYQGTPNFYIESKEIISVEEVE